MIAHMQCIAMLNASEVVGSVHSTHLPLQRSPISISLLMTELSLNCMGTQSIIILKEFCCA